MKHSIIVVAAVATVAAGCGSGRASHGETIRLDHVTLDTSDGGEDAVKISYTVVSLTERPQHEATVNGGEFVEALNRGLRVGGCYTGIAIGHSHVGNASINADAAQPATCG